MGALHMHAVKAPTTFVHKRHTACHVTLSRIYAADNSQLPRLLFRLYAGEYGCSIYGDSCTATLDLACIMHLATHTEHGLYFTCITLSLHPLYDILASIAQPFTYTYIIHRSSSLSPSTSATMASTSHVTHRTHTIIASLTMR